MVSNFTSKIVAFFSIPIAVYSVQRFASIPLGNTFVWWFIHGVILIAFFWEVRYNEIDPADRKSIRVLKWYLLWNVFSIVRGALFMAESYWDYKSLADMGMSILVPVIAYIVLDRSKVQIIFYNYIKYALPLAVFVFPFLGFAAWGWYLFPICFLLLFLPALTFKGKFIVLFITVIVLASGILVRSYLFKFGVPALLLVFFYFRFFPGIAKIMEFGRKLLLFLPILLFVLAVSGIFNVFNMNQYVGEDLASEKETTTKANGDTQVSGLTDDSRTFLYVEVLASAIKYDYWLIGRSPARGNETFFFAKEMIKYIGKPERIRNEAGILNVFTWTGIIGVILIFLVFYKASFIAINHSNNIYAKILGLCVAFRWVYFWVEDYQAFDLNSIIIWMMIGVCFSKSFREMPDIEVKLWVRGIFSDRYLNIFRKHSKYSLVDN